MNDFRSHFEIADVVHLSNASMAPLTREAVQATSELAKFFATHGALDIDLKMQQMEQHRECFASLVGVGAHQVAMVPSCATGISQVAFGYPWKRGDEILTLDQEYPSNAYPWIRVAERFGLNLIQHESGPDLSVDFEAFCERIGPSTTMVAISWVQYQTGATAPLEEISRRCQEVGAWLVVDGTQGVGVLPLAMGGIDALCVSNHKWLCGPLGHGFLVLAEDKIEKLSPLSVGALTYGDWTMQTDARLAPKATAHRFEPGAPAFFGTFASAASIKVMLELGIDIIHHQAMDLVRRLEDGLRANGDRIITQTDTANRSAILTFEPRIGVDKTKLRLEKARITFGQRAGGIRISPHGYNTSDEIDQLLSLLSD